MQPTERSHFMSLSSTDVGTNLWLGCFIITPWRWEVCTADVCSSVRRENVRRWVSREGFYLSSGRSRGLGVSALPAGSEGTLLFVVFCKERRGWIFSLNRQRFKSNMEKWARVRSPCLTEGAAPCSPRSSCCAFWTPWSCACRIPCRSSWKRVCLWRPLWLLNAAAGEQEFSWPSFSPGSPSSFWWFYKDKGIKNRDRKIEKRTGMLPEGGPTPVLQKRDLTRYSCFPAVVSSWERP